MSYPQQLEHIVEGALLAAGKPLTVNQLKELFHPDDNLPIPSTSDVKAALVSIGASCQGRGFELKEVAGGWRFQVRDHLAPWINRLWEEKPPKYSRAMLETLALIAYRQPITRGEIEEVRGVAVSSNILRTLMERDWVKIVGYKESPGRPSLLATTRRFLDYFNLRSLEELPSLAELADIAPATADVAADHAVAEEGGVPNAVSEEGVADLPEAAVKQPSANDGESVDDVPTANGDTMSDTIFDDASQSNDTDTDSEASEASEEESTEQSGLDLEQEQDVPEQDQDGLELESSDSETWQKGPSEPEGFEPKELKQEGLDLEELEHEEREQKAPPREKPKVVAATSADEPPIQDHFDFLTNERESLANDSNSLNNESDREPQFVGSDTDEAVEKLTSNDDNVEPEPTPKASKAASESNQPAVNTTLVPELASESLFSSSLFDQGVAEADSTEPSDTPSPKPPAEKDD